MPGENVTAEQAETRERQLVLDDLNKILHAEMYTAVTWEDLLEALRMLRSHRDSDGMWLDITMPCDDAPKLAYVQGQNFYRLDGAAADAAPPTLSDWERTLCRAALDYASARLTAADVAAARERTDPGAGARR